MLSLWFMGWTVLLQLIPVHADLVTVRSTAHCLNIFMNDPKNYAAFPSKLENQPFTLCPKYTEEIPRVPKIWYTFGFDRSANLKTLPLESKALWQRTYEISDDAGEIVFNDDYCVTPDSKTTPWIAGTTVCPECSPRDVRANGAHIVETNPYVLSEYSGGGPDSPAVLGVCNNGGVGREGTPESMLPAGSDLVPSGGSSTSEEFNLQSDTTITGPQAASVANDGRYAYVDSTLNNNGGSSNFLNTDFAPLPKLSSTGSPGFPYVDPSGSGSGYRPLVVEGTAKPNYLEQPPSTTLNAESSPSFNLFQNRKRKRGASNNQRSRRRSLLA